MIDVFDPELEALVDPDAALEAVADGFEFTEGPVWREPQGYLLFSDIPNDVICRWDPAGGITEHRRPSRKSNGLTYDGAGRLLACEHSSSTVTCTDQDGVVFPVASHWQGKELNSPNDVAVARSGAIYFTDPSDGRTSERWGLVRPRQLDFHGVYLVPAGGGDTVLLADDFPFPNGVCLSPDERTLYVNDTTRMHVRAFDVRPDGTVERDRVFLEQPGTGDMWDGVPDGMACDELGNLWATGPLGIWVASPEGRPLGRVRTPKFASNLCFGGTDWSDVYITVSDVVYRLPTRTRGARLPHVVQGELQQIADRLRTGLRTGRITVRVDDVPGEVFRVKAESCAPGVGSIAAHHTEGVRESETFRWVDRERRPLVQEDILASPITPAPVLVERYGARAQILAPVVARDNVVGLISVHETSGLRQWQESDVAQVEQAAAEVAGVLE